MTPRKLVVFALPLAALLAVASPSFAESELDPLETLEEAKETYDELRDVLAKYENTREALDALAEIDAARITWQLYPEDVNLGIEWANKTAKGFEHIKNFIPPGLPGPVEEMISGLLSAVPVYVDALTKQLKKEIARIDAAADAASGSVYYDKQRACENGLIAKSGVKIIKRLDVEEYEKQEIFQRACHLGLRRALAEYDLL